MKKIGCDKCKSNSIIQKCILCQINICSDDCLKDHLKESHQNENKVDSIMENLNKKRISSINSPFLILGEYIKELNYHNSLYDFMNFEIMFIGKRPNVIGCGAFGEVFLAKNKLTQQFFAIKQVKFDIFR